MTALTKALWLNGKAVLTERIYELFAPYDGKLLAYIAKGNEDDVKEAIKGTRENKYMLREMAELKFVTINR